MPAVLRRCAVILVLCGFAVGPAFSQETPPADSLGFKMSMGIGIQNFHGPVEPGTFSSIGLAPDISFGKFGIGLDLTINYNTENGSLYIRRADWVVNSFQNFLEVYLPKIAYIRYGVKGDPLFLKLGSFADATLGDGFIMGNYNNMLFMPGPAPLRSAGGSGWKTFQRALLRLRICHRKSRPDGRDGRALVCAAPCRYRTCRF